jgi:hypothetical protein
MGQRGRVKVENEFALRLLGPQLAKLLIAAARGTAG